jgi:ABC-type lipoprotein export system ATPase subunit
LLLDEPSASLDPENVERLILNIQVASAESRVPIIVVTHNPADFAKLDPSYYQLVGKPAEISKA